MLCFYHICPLVQSQMSWAAVFNSFSMGAEQQGIVVLTVGERTVRVLESREMLNFTHTRDKNGPADSRCDVKIDSFRTKITSLNIIMHTDFCILYNPNSGFHLNKMKTKRISRVSGVWVMKCGPILAWYRFTAAEEFMVVFEIYFVSWCAKCSEGQHQDSSTTKPCCYNSCNMWFCIFLLK